MGSRRELVRNRDRLIMRCLDCHYPAELPPAETRTPACTHIAIRDWRERLLLRCGSRDVDMEVTATERRYR